MQIIKRDGRTIGFQKSKITEAIIRSMNETSKGIDMVLADKISESISKLNKVSLSVEDIQDIVEQKLMQSNRKDVAKQYIAYRSERTRMREINNEINTKIKNIVACSDVQNANANVDEHSFGGRKFESAGVIHKKIGLEMMRPETALAHKENRVYQHDLDSYDIGMHNCLFLDMERVLNNGFETRNGDVRPASSYSTACQLVAVAFQVQSQVQFGGCGSAHIDYDLKPFVKKSFVKHFKDGLKYIDELTQDDIDNIVNENEVKLGNLELEMNFKKSFKYAVEKTDKEGLQASQGLYHNLNTLESRAGSQVPFTSINFGRDKSIEGRKVTEWMLKSSIDGIGKNHRTSIFPISIFQYKKGENDIEGTPNYDLKKLAIKSLTKRIYPNIVNCDYSMNIEDPNNPDTFHATMGCRTEIGFDRHGLGYSKVGRGNVAPVTINLPKIGIKHGICVGDRIEPDLEGFWKEFDEVLAISSQSLVDRFYHICSQNYRSAPFMYTNGTIADFDKVVDKGIYEAMKHGTLALGYIGIAEMCQALFGKNHAEDIDVHKFAVSVVKYIHEYAKKVSNIYNLNFSCYASPAENLCKTMMNGLQKEFGIIENVTSKSYLTNSHHVPVWQKVSISEKLNIEAPFCKYPTGGCITYVELDSAIIKNEKAIEDIIDYAMSLDIPYLAFNFPIDTCLDCGYQGEFNNNCLACGSTNIQQLRRVTGYLTTDYRNFNDGKIAEVEDRVKHSKYTDFGE
jgi:anaerobic ribonucleoside-triphosphate reductase